MTWFYNLRIAHKLNAAFLIVLVFLVTLGGLSAMQLASVNKSATDIARNWLPSITTLSRMSLSLSRSRSFDLQQMLAADPKEQATARDRADQQIAILVKETERYGKLVSEPREKELYPEVLRGINEYQSLHERY